jgi:hypothetical protein
MGQVMPKRVAARIDGDFVVFLIGMRINRPWKIHKWLPVLRAMPRMIRELEAHPESGFLGHIMSSRIIVQYWRSFEHLEAYARDTDQLHWPAWTDFNRRVGGSRGDVGIWHETYKVRAGENASTAGCHLSAWPRRVVRRTLLVNSSPPAIAWRREALRARPSRSNPLTGRYCQ